MENHIKEFTDLIEELHQVLQKGRSIPLMKQEIVDADALKRLVTRLRASLPDALVAASRIVNERDDILRQANLEHQKRVDESEIVQEARVIRSKMLKESEAQVQKILDDAQAKAGHEADQIRQDADRYAQKSKEKIFNYALEMLKSVHESLSQSMENVSEVRNTLNASSQVLEEWMERIVKEKEKP